MDRSTHASGGPIHGEILKLPHNEALFDAIQARGGIVQLHSPQPEILQVDYAARKWPDITWILDHMCASLEIVRVASLLAMALESHTLHDTAVNFVGLRSLGRTRTR